MSLELESIISEGCKNKRKIVEENINEVVIVEDDHHSWIVGKIIYSDKDIYLLDSPKRRNPWKLHYHDIKTMLVVKDYKKY